MSVERFLCGWKVRSYPFPLLFFNILSVSLYPFCADSPVSLYSVSYTRDRSFRRDPQSTMKTAKGKGTLKVSGEVLKPADDRKIGKRKAAAAINKSAKRKTNKDKKAKKDPNKPKRPPSAFFVFLEEFRQTFKKENPNVSSVAAVGKAGGQKWKSMSPDEKAPYEAKAAKRKAEYGKLMNAYNKKQEVEQEEEKEVVEDEQEEEEEEEEDDDDEEDDD
ncbi:hypothetical protein K2173_008435 [Erythroxylum novogranatense]|uniref:HMG box domain-containing protein n=1 Tax=Erythroxylum novogranatense TaxID=1862640 RepID=A0AAV8S4U8_9ROSI|nr:hypothetical protein K2173_008435 [Erythroxylum novogranatense]